MRILLFLTFCLIGTMAAAQGTGVALGGFDYNAGQPVEITADSLEVSQSDGTATFAGNVVIGQSEMRLSAGKVVVEYGPTEDGANQIKRLLATGGVTLVGASEAAEAETATFLVAQGIIELAGDVLLTQGAMAIGGDRLIVNLETGNGSIEGNVRTLLNTGSGN